MRYGFTVHTFAAPFACSRHAPSEYAANQDAVNTAIQLAAVVVIWLMIRNRVFFGVISSLKLGFSNRPISNPRGVIRIGSRRP
jgi:hypothetical protein